MNEYEIEIVEGASFSLGFVLSEVDDFGDKTPVDLTGFTIKSQIRRTYLKDAPVILDFTTVLDQPAQGSFALTLTSQQTALLELQSLPEDPTMSLGFYDIFLTSPTGSRSLLLRGNVIYHHAVTKELVE